MKDQNHIFKLSTRNAVKVISLTCLVTLAACNQLGRAFVTETSSQTSTLSPTGTLKPTNSPTLTPTDTPIPPSETPVQLGEQESTTGEAIENEEFDIETETLFSYHFLKNSELDTIIGIELDNSSYGFTDKLTEAIGASGLKAGDLQPIGVKLIGKGNSEKRYLLVKKDGSESFMYVEYIVLDPKAEHSPDRLDIMPPGKGDKGLLMPLRDYPAINNAEGILTEDISLSQEFISPGSGGNPEQNYFKVVSLFQMIYDETAEKINEFIYKDPFTRQRLIIPIDLIDLETKVNPTPSGLDLPTPGPFTISLIEALETVEPLFPDRDDMTIRMWLPRPSNVDLPQKLLPYGVVKDPDIFRPEVAKGIRNHWVSGILLGYTVLENDIIEYQLGIPDYETNHFRKFTLVHRVLWHEPGNPDSTHLYAYRDTNPHGHPGGFNVDGGVNTYSSLDGAKGLLNESIGKQTAFLIELSDNSQEMVEYLESQKDGYCHNILNDCIGLVDDIIKSWSDIEIMLSALKCTDNKPVGKPGKYEEKKLLIVVRLPILPIK